MATEPLIDQVNEDPLSNITELAEGGKVGLFILQDLRQERLNRRDQLSCEMQATEVLLLEQCGLFDVTQRKQLLRHRGHLLELGLLQELVNEVMVLLDCQVWLNPFLFVSL